ncbi:hypothetical protein [Spirulina major]|uniref:hypothetical protein n=1 Tax=Spirulina major TaxID=270636 RepID=UPI000A44EF9F|nr:hypothetical protein [Spirulina major]
MDLDPKLVQRLTRPIHQPGVTNHRMADRLIDRAERLVNRLPLLDQQLARWSAIADLETEDIPIVYAQVNEADQSAADDWPQDQPQRVQGKNQTDSGEGDLPIAVATPMQPSIPPDLSRVEPSQAPQIGTETGNPKTAIAPLAPIVTTTAPIIQAQRDLVISPDAAPLDGVTPPLPLDHTDQFSTPQAQGRLQTSPPEADRGSMPSTSAPVVEAIAPLGPVTNQTTGVIQAKLETGATPAQPLEMGEDHDAIAPVQAAESLQSVTASPIDQPSVIKNPAFDPQVMQAALSLDQPNLNPLPRDLPLATMPPAVNQNESGHSELEDHRVSAIAPSPAQSATVEILTTPLSPDSASSISDSMPLVQPSASSESASSEAASSEAARSKSARSKSTRSKSARSKSARSKSARSEAAAPRVEAIAPLGPVTNQTTGVIQAKLETGATPAQPLEMGVDHNAIAPVQAAESLQSVTASPIDQSSVIKNPAFDPQVMQAALSLDQPNLNPLPRDLPLAAMPPAVNQNESGHSELEDHRVSAIAPSPAQSATVEILTTPLSPDSAHSDSMPLVQPSASSEAASSEAASSEAASSKSARSKSARSKSARSKSARSEAAAPRVEAIAPLGPVTNQTTGVIQAKLETGATPAQPLAIGEDQNAIAPVQAAESLQSVTASPIDQSSVIKNPAFDPQVMQAALSLDQPNLNPLPRDLPLATMPPAVNQNESGHSELEDHRVSAIAPSPAQSATSEILTTPLSPDSASPTPDSMPLVQPSASSEAASSEAARLKSASSKSASSKSTTSKSASLKSARSEAAAPIGGAIAPLATNQTTGVIQAKLETGAKLVQPLEMESAAQPLNGGEDQSAKALPPPKPDIQPQTTALPTIQTRPFTEGIVQAKFAAGATLPMVAPSEGLALSPHSSGFTSLNLAASNPIAAPLTTVPAGVTEPILTPFTPPRFPAVVSVPSLDPAPPPSIVLHAQNFRAEQENPLAHPQQAIATIVPRDGGDRRYPQDQPIFLGLNRIEGDQADGAKGSGAIAVPNRVAISPQVLATPSEQGQDFTFVLPNQSETATMPQTAALVQALEPITPRVQPSSDANHPGSRVQSVEMPQPISPLVNAEIGRNTSPELVVTTSQAANPMAASATPALPRAIAQPLPSSRNPAHEEQPALAVFSRPLEVPPSTPTALGVTAQAQPSRPVSPPPKQSPLRKEKREKRNEAGSSSLLKTAVSPIQPSATRSQRLTPTPQTQSIPLPTVQVKTEFNPQNLEPLVLSGPMVRSHRTAVSQETHRAAQTRSQTPNSPVVISPALPNPPPATASPGQQSSSTTGPRAKSTTTQVAKQTTPAAVNIDDLVAKVERKVLKRLVVERERRGGQRQWR